MPFDRWQDGKEFIRGVGGVVLNAGGHSTSDQRR